MKKTQTKKKPPDPIKSPYADDDEIVDWARHLFGVGKKVVLPATVCPKCRSNRVDLFQSRQWQCPACGATGQLLIKVSVDREHEQSKKVGLRGRHNLQK